MKSLLLTCTLPILLIVWLPTSAVAEEPATIVEVVVEGAGLSLEDAQKDAYRKAVRTVVGLYVDSKTIVENDELIEDRILSAANGFVKTAKTIPGSAKENDGIWRLRIRAKVEVSEVSARLKKENIAIRSLDGESLFNKALTKIEDRQNTQQQIQQLQELLGELPKMVKVSVLGEPDYDDVKGELIYQVQLTPDVDAYRKFLPRLIKELDRLAVKKLSEEIVRPQPSTRSSQKGVSVVPLKRQLDQRTKPSQGIISVLTFWNERHSSHRWTTYVVELGELGEVNLATPNGLLKKRHWLQALSRSWPPSGGQTYDYGQLRMRVTAQFLDKQKAVLELDPWEWKCDDYRNWAKLAHRYHRLESLVPNLMVTPLSRYKEDRFGFGWPWGRPSAETWDHFVIAAAPICMARHWDHRGANRQLLMRPHVTMKRRIRFPLEDLKKISEIKLNVETFVDKSK